jgi:hypothetical protein
VAKRKKKLTNAELVAELRDQIEQRLVVQELELIDPDTGDVVGVVVTRAGAKPEDVAKVLQLERQVEDEAAFERMREITTGKAVRRRGRGG